MHFKVKAAVTGDQLEEIMKLGASYSPVFDT
jgi:hypothetical protein